MRYKLFVGKFTVGAIWRESKSFQEIVKRVNLVIMGKGRKNFYAVRVGRSTGVYSTWYVVYTASELVVNISKQKDDWLNLANFVFVFLISGTNVNLR